MPKLVITDTEGSRTVALDREVKAGRLAENDIQLKVPEASRHHCRFFEEKGSWFVEDMGSSNGTLVNGRKVSKFELQDGDLIAVGAATMRFLDTAPTAAEAGAPAGGWGDDEISLEEQVFLVLGAPGRHGEVVRISGDRITVGRKPKHGLVLAEPSVSQDHAEIRKAGGEWVLKDLGSSNGTFVDGERVSEARIRSGAVVTFGEIGTTFGIGDPADFSAPEPAVAVESGHAETTIMETESAFADPTFALSEVEERKSPVASVLAILLLAVLAGGLGWLYMNRGRLSGDRDDGGGGDATSLASNLVPQKFWSFEPVDVDPAAEEQAGWHKEDAIDPASAGEVGDVSRSGDQAWSIERREAERPGSATWVSLSGGAECDLGVTPGATYRLGGFVRLRSGEPAPGIAVTWLEPLAGGETREVARDVVPAVAESGRWTAAFGLVQAPEGANRAHVGLVLGGIGEALYDDVVFEPAATPPERSLDVRGFRAWLGESGAVRVFHFARAVSDGMGVRKVVPEGVVPPWQAFVPASGGNAGAVAGALRDGGATVSVALAPEENAFRATWRFGGPTPGQAILIPLAGATGEVDVTLVDGDRARRMRAAFQGANAGGVIVGGQGDRMRIRFLDAEQKPFSTGLDVVTDGGRSFLKLDRGDRASIVLHCDLSFDAELSQARELIARAGDAASRQRFGEAMTLYDEVLARFPFDETIERQASAALEKLTSDGRARIRAFTARVDDARFFRTARLDDDLVAEMQADVERYAGTSLEPELKARLDELSAERKKSAAEKHDGEAKRTFQRAQDYLDMKQSRREVAITLLEMVVNRYPDTEWAQQAQALLEKLKAG
jgi:pSer/pThr/pTyr-binding forkhead associated (FHA) protein